MDNIGVQNSNKSVLGQHIFEQNWKHLEEETSRKPCNNISSMNILTLANNNNKDHKPWRAGSKQGTTAIKKISKPMEPETTLKTTPPLAYLQQLFFTGATKAEKGLETKQNKTTTKNQSRASCHNIETGLFDFLACGFHNVDSPLALPCVFCTLSLSLAKWLGTSLSISI